VEGHEEGQGEVGIFLFFFGIFKSFREVFMVEIKQFRLKLYVKEFAKEFYKDTLRFPLLHEWAGDTQGAMFDIGENKVLIISWGPKPVGILIESEQVAKNFRDYFEVVWKMAK
jgi:hypothetical protein